MEKQTKEVAVIEKLEELKDYATQAQNPYLLGRINRIMQEVKTDGITQSLEPLKEEHVFEYKSNNDEDLKMVSEILENYHEEDVHEVAAAKPIQKEVTWESIQEDFLSTSDHKDNLSEIDVYFVFEWLSKNYNAPTKKQ